MYNLKTIELKSPKVGVILTSGTSTQQDRANFASTLVKEAKERSGKILSEKLKSKNMEKVY